MVSFRDTAVFGVKQPSHASQSNLPVLKACLHDVGLALLVGLALPTGLKRSASLHAKTNKKLALLREPALACGGVALVVGFRPWRIVLLKVAYYATSSARNFAKLCQNSQIMPLVSEIMLTI